MFLEKTEKQVLLKQVLEKQVLFQISKADLITTHLTNLNTNSESIWTETEIKGMKPIVMCTFYRTPHDSQGTQIEELDLSLSKLGNKINTHNVIITGDFNLPNINWENIMLHLTVDIVQLLPTNYSLL